MTSDLIIYGSLTLFGISLSLLAFIEGRRLIRNRKLRRQSHFQTLYGPAVQRIMEKVARGEKPVYHTYHSSHREYIYQQMLAYARENPGDYHEAFDLMGFTDDLLAASLQGGTLKILEDLAVIRSPLCKEYLYISLLDPDPEVSSRAAKALTLMPPGEGDRELILPSLLNLDLAPDLLADCIGQLGPPLELCQQLLDENPPEKAGLALRTYMSKTRLN